MINPIRRIRLLEGRTLQEFADDIGIHYQAVYLNECGVYHTVLPVIMKHLVSLGLNRRELEIEYEEAVRFKRELNGLVYQFNLIDDLGEPTGINPFTQFREKLNLTGLSLTRSKFCKLFGVHPALIRKLELFETRTMPTQLQEALRDAGLATTVIDELCDRLEEQVGWRVGRASRFL